MKNCIVTGSAGFIGSHLCERLLNEGHHVIGIDNLLTGKTKNMSTFRDHPEFEFVEEDILSTGQIAQYLGMADIIFHEAASKKTISLTDPCRDIDINAKGTFKLLDTLIKVNTNNPAFIHASTGSVYGEANGEITLNTLTQPTSVYGVSKLAGERYVDLFNRNHDLRTAILRYFHVYGPRQDDGPNGGVVAIFINKLLHNQPIQIFGSGMQTRVFTYVDDVVDVNLGVVSSLPTNRCMPVIHNVTSGVQTTLIEMLHMLAMILGRTKFNIEFGPWTPGDIVEFNVKPTYDRHKWVSFKDGLEKTVEWYKQKYGG